MSKRHTAEEIVAKPRQVEVLKAQGEPVGEAIRSIGVSEVTYYRWRSEYGGLRGDQVKRLGSALAQFASSRSALRTCVCRRPSERSAEDDQAS